MASVQASLHWDGLLWDWQHHAQDAEAGSGRLIKTTTSATVKTRERRVMGRCVGEKDVMGIGIDGMGSQNRSVVTSLCNGVSATKKQLLPLVVVVVERVFFVEVNTCVHNLKDQTKSELMIFRRVEVGLELAGSSRVVCFRFFGFLIFDFLDSYFTF